MRVIKPHEKKSYLQLPTLPPPPPWLNKLNIKTKTRSVKITAMLNRIRNNIEMARITVMSGLKNRIIESNMNESVFLVDLVNTLLNNSS